MLLLKSRIAVFIMGIVTFSRIQSQCFIVFPSTELSTCNTTCWGMCRFINQNFLKGK